MSHGRRWVAVMVTVMLVTTLLPLTACSTDRTDTEDATTDGLVVVTTVLPMKWLIEQVGGEDVRVTAMVEPGEDPHTYEPSPADLRSLSEADAYVTVSLEFEDAWLPRFTSANPQMEVIDATVDVEPLDAEDEHGEKDPHVWTSPAAMKVMGATIAEHLASLDPENAEHYEENLSLLQSEIDALDAELSATFEAADSSTFMVFHPAWGYFARDYDLEQVAVEVGGQEPSAAELADLIDLAREKDISVIFVQPSMSTRTATVIAEEIGAEVVVVDPLAEDWLNNMYTVADAFKKALER